jgi:putative chitinase
MIDARKLQAAVNASPVDGILGAGSFAALFRKCGATPDRAAELGIAANRWFPDYGILDSTLRLAHFMAQVIHESGGFRYMEEIWGPTEAQRSYEGRTDLGNTQPGDGSLYRGRGPIQITGRANYRKYGRLIGIDLERHPELAAIPSIGLHTALEFWKQHSLNAFADQDMCETITRRINGGLNGFGDRCAHLKRVKEWLA